MFVLISFNSCTKKSKVEKEVEKMELNLQIYRFEKAFFETQPEKLNELKILLKTYNSDKDYNNRLTELLKIKKEELSELKLDIDKIISKNNTSGRKVVYENNEIDMVDANRWFLLFIYFTLFIYYIFVSDYFSTSKYKDIKVWLLILVYFIFPYILNWITKKIFTIYDYLNYLFLNRKYKNVFLSLDS